MVPESHTIENHECTFSMGATKQPVWVPIPDVIMKYVNQKFAPMKTWGTGMGLLVRVTGKYFHDPHTLYIARHYENIRDVSDTPIPCISHERDGIEFMITNSQFGYKKAGWVRLAHKHVSFSFVLVNGITSATVAESKMFSGLKLRR